MLMRKIRKRVEHAFYNYASLKQSGAERIVELAENGLVKAMGADNIHSGQTSDPTSNKALKLADGGDMDMDIRWCLVVENTLAHFEGTGKDTLIKQKYWNNLSEWRLCDMLYIERSVLYDWLKDIMIYAAMWGIQENLIKLE